MALPNIIVRISSNESRHCPICRQVSLSGTDDFEAAYNHLLGHGLTCLHVGPETIQDKNGGPWHTTVALFGLTTTGRTARGRKKKLAPKAVGKKGE